MTDEDKVNNDKAVQFYAAKANAWFNTKLEYDKSLLILSAGAIGLLITLLTTVGVKSITLLLIFIVAIISFIICLIAILGIFSRNAKHLEDLIQNKNINDSVLSILDSVTILSFILGVILTSIIGISIATNEVLRKEIMMTDKKETVQKNVFLKDSFNGAKNLSPQEPEVLLKSFNNAQNIAPQSSDSDTTSTSDSSTSETNEQSQSNDSSSSNDNTNSHNE